jgi:PAS domain S-box-containing protein
MYKSFNPEDLMAVLEGISDAVVKLDADSNYVAMNGAAADIFRRLGRDPQQMLGKSLWEVFPDVKGTIVERKIREALEQHVLTEYEFFYPADQHWYAVRAYPSHPGAILISRDISQQKATKSD